MALREGKNPTESRIFAILRSKLKLLPHEYDLEGKDLIAYELTGRGLKSLQHECPLLAATSCSLIRDENVPNLTAVRCY